MRLTLKNEHLRVNKTLEFEHAQKYWRAGPPKDSTEIIAQFPLDEQSLRCSEKAFGIAGITGKESPPLCRRQAMNRHLQRQTSQLVMRDLVFINWRTGEPAKNNSMIPTFTSSATKQG